MSTPTNVSQWDNSTTPPTNPTRSPSSWAPSGLVEVLDSAGLQGPNKWQALLAVRPGRGQFTIVNTGAYSCEISNEPQGAGQHGVTVAPGGVWSEQTEDSVYVYCVGGTTLDVTETYTPLYDVVQAADGSGAGGTIPYIAPLLPGGATPID